MGKKSYELKRKNFQKKKKQNYYLGQISIGYIMHKKKAIHRNILNKLQISMY